jgi:hypothetical protein
VQRKIGALGHRDFFLYDGPRLSSHNARQTQSSCRSQLSPITDNGVGTREANAPTLAGHDANRPMTVSQAAQGKFELLREELP